MAYAETTNPDLANPFATTGSASPAEIRRQAEAVWSRLAKKHKRSQIREPDLYWEEPGLHGRGREYSLRGKEEIGTVTGRWSRKALRLPPVPHNRVGTTETVLLVGLVVGAAGLAWYLWQRRNPKDRTAATAHVGDDFSGLNELGAS
jgi:hypothetical protein